MLVDTENTSDQLITRLAVDMDIHGDLHGWIHRRRNGGGQEGFTPPGFSLPGQQTFTRGVYPP